MNVQRLHALEHQGSWQFRVRRKLSKQPKLEQNAFQNWYKMFNDMYSSFSDVKTGGSKGLLLK